MSFRSAQQPDADVRSDVDGADRPGRATRIAGVVLVVVGLANIGFGALSLATDLVRLAPPDAGMLAVLGAGTCALGALVWQGRRWAVTTSLLVFGVLFVLQAAVTTTAEDPTATLPALVTLAVVVLPLVLAYRGAGRR